MFAVSTPPKPSPSLYELEDQLCILADSEALITPDQEQEFRAEFQEVLLAAANKRDAVARFLAHCESQATLAKLEIERLKKRQAGFLSAVERIEDYVVGVILHQTPDAKGRYAPLEGKVSRFAIQRNPPSIAITDEAKVPAQCKTITVTMPLPVWESTLDTLDLETRRQVEEAGKRPEVAVVKTLVKAALKEGPVEGAHQADGTWRLVRT